MNQEQLYLKNHATYTNGTCTVMLLTTCTFHWYQYTVGLICSLGCSQRKTTKIYCPIIEGATHSTFSDTLQHLRQLQQQISGVQQQGLVASQRCKNLAARCFKGETGNDVRKHMIRSRLSNVSDAHVLAEAGIDARAPFFSCQIQ